MTEQRLQTIREHAGRGDLQQADKEELVALCDLALWALKIKRQTVQRVERSRARQRKARGRAQQEAQAIGAAVAANATLGELQAQLARLEKPQYRKGGKL